MVAEAFLGVTSHLVQFIVWVVIDIENKSIDMQTRLVMTVCELTVNFVRVGYWFHSIRGRDPGSQQVHLLVIMGLTGVIATWDVFMVVVALQQVRELFLGSHYFLQVFVWSVFSVTPGIVILGNVWIGYVIVRILHVEGRYQSDSEGMSPCALRNFAPSPHRLQFGALAANVANITTCTICLEDFLEEDWIKKLPCSHMFHERCIDKWLLKTSHCPFRCKSSWNSVVRSAVALTSEEADDIPGRHALHEALQLGELADDFVAPEPRGTHSCCICFLAFFGSWSRLALSRLRQTFEQRDPIEGMSPHDGTDVLQAVRSCVAWVSGSRSHRHRQFPPFDGDSVVPSLPAEMPPLRQLCIRSELGETSMVWPRCSVGDLGHLDRQCPWDTNHILDPFSPQVSWCKTTEPRCSSGVMTPVFGVVEVGLPECEQLVGSTELLLEPTFDDTDSLLNDMSSTCVFKELPKFHWEGFAWISHDADADWDGHSLSVGSDSRPMEDGVGDFAVGRKHDSLARVPSFGCEDNISTVPSFHGDDGSTSWALEESVDGCGIATCTTEALDVADTIDELDEVYACPDSVAIFWPIESSCYSDPTRTTMSLWL